MKKIATSITLCLSLAACNNELGLPDTSVKILNGKSHGTAFFIDGGFLLTAAHVLGDKKNLKIKDSKGNEVEVKVLWSSPENDIALLETSKPFKSRRSKLNCDGAKQGEEVFTIGNPIYEEFSYSKGHIAVAKSKKLDVWDSVITLDMSIAPGNSGGPVYNNKNEVVGLVVGVMTFQTNAFSRSFTGFSYAVPAKTICTLMGK